MTSERPYKVWPPAGRARRFASREAAVRFAASVAREHGHQAVWRVGRGLDLVARVGRDGSVATIAPD